MPGWDFPASIYDQFAVCGDPTVDAIGDQAAAGHPLRANASTPEIGSFSPGDSGFVNSSGAAVAGYSEGPVAEFNDPSDLGDYGIYVDLADTSTTADPQGEATVQLHDINGNWWVGVLTLTNSATGWQHYTIQPTNYYQWTYETSSGWSTGPGLADSTNPADAYVYDTTTVAGLISDASTSGGGIDAVANAPGWEGMAFGCHGQPFYFDGLQVNDDASTTSYDFEAAPTTAEITRQIGSGNPKAVKATTITAGQSVSVLGDAYAGDVWYGAYFFAGDGAMVATRKGHTTSSVVATKSFTASSYGHYNLSPTVSTRYQLATDGGPGGFASAASPSVTVTVKPRMGSVSYRKRVHEGDTIEVKGKAVSGATEHAVLQRFVHGHWRTLHRQTDHPGRGSKGYVLKTTATSVGTWKLRVYARAGKHGVTAANQTHEFTVKVERLPPPPQPVVHHSTYVAPPVNHYGAALPTPTHKVGKP